MTMLIESGTGPPVPDGGSQDRGAQDGIAHVSQDRGPQDNQQVPSSQDRLFEQAYNELRHIAGRLMGREFRVHTIQATTLVHEAYLRLRQASRLDNAQIGEFLPVAARAMRQVLVDKVRRKLARRRGGSEVRVALEEEPQIGNEDRTFEVIRLDEALKRLGEQDARLEQVVELRIFAGLEMDLIASLLGVSRRTIYSDWAVARRWLDREMAEA